MTQSYDTSAFIELQKAMVESELKGSDTRPKITWLMAIIVTAYMVFYLICMVYGIGWKDKPLPEWEEIAAILGIPSFILRSYFQMRSDDKQLRALVAMGHNPLRPSIRGAIAERLQPEKVKE